MNDVKKKLNVVLLAFRDEKGGILLNRRADAASEMWELIGGGIEEGEQPLDAIKREVYEEVGYVLSNPKDDLQFVRNFRFEDETISAIVNIFMAKFPGFQSFTDSDETFVADLKLFDLSDALRVELLPITKEILDKQYIS